MPIQQPDVLVGTLRAEWMSEEPILSADPQGTTGPGLEVGWDVWGPEDLNLVVTDSRWETGTRVVRVDASVKGRRKRLFQDLELTGTPAPHDTTKFELQVAKVELGPGPLRCELRPAALDDLEHASGVDLATAVSDALIWDDGDGTSMLVNVESVTDPLIAFLAGQVLPISNLAHWSVERSTVGYRPSQRTPDKGGRRIYVVLLDSAVSPTSDSPAVYVGQTGKWRSDRFREHKIGYKASRWVRDFGVRLMPELFPEDSDNLSREEADSLESDWAFELELSGYEVRGGH